MYQPLAYKLRPDKLADFVGQKQIVGPDSWLKKSIKSDQLQSLLLWGPPGVGKTTLAHIISKETKSEFLSLSAVTSGVKDLKEIVEKARENKVFLKKTILFIDEIHRWNKSQQDALLPHIENGLLVLIGATTENPSFSLNSALLSRLKVLILEPLSDKDLSQIIKKSSTKLNLNLDKEHIALIAGLSDGDARVALNLLESLLGYKNDINSQLIKDLFNKPNLRYDKNNDEHYNIISALHKSMRASNPKAALYWLARMLEAGEDPLYVARRIIRFASEDIGLANNSALMIANQAHDACAKIGMPECKLALAQAVLYMSKSAKSILVYQSYNDTVSEINTSGSLPVPKHLRNASNTFLKSLEYGKDYKYSPLEDDSKQEYLPKNLKSSKFKNMKL